MHFQILCEATNVMVLQSCLLFYLCRHFLPSKGAPIKNHNHNFFVENFYTNGKLFENVTLKLKEKIFQAKNIKTT